MGFGIFWVLVVGVVARQGSTFQEAVPQRRADCAVVCGSESELPESLCDATNGMAISWRATRQECDADHPPDWFSLDRRLDVVVVESEAASAVQRLWIERMRSLGKVGRVVEIDTSRCEGSGICLRRFEQIAKTLDREFPGAGERLRVRIARRLLEPSQIDRSQRVDLRD